MMMMMGGRSSPSSRHPFTPAQWQELEHQVLIFRYMASGIPIPSELILPIRRSLYLQSTNTTLAFFPPQLTTGWGCFQMGLGSKEEDPEPWRCRRTDGKKWRCSKEASLDSKYCERHMHRGRSRSRKPVEVTSASPSNSSHASSSTYLPHISVPSKPPSLEFSLHDITTDFHLGTVSHSSSNMNYRHGMDEVVDENSPSSKANGQESEKQHHFFSLNRDIKLDTPVKVMEEHQRKPKIFGQFLDGVPLESKGSWLDREKGRSNLTSYSRAHLSTSIPIAYHDFL